MAPHPNVWLLIEGLKKDIAIQRLVIISEETNNADKPKAKYTKLAERLSAKVYSYPAEPDKLKYLRAIAHLT